MFILTVSSVLLLLAMIVGLYIKSMPILQENSFWDLVTSSVWKPSQKIRFPSVHFGNIGRHIHCNLHLTAAFPSHCNIIDRILEEDCA